jgi:diguanylate cyclase (GGDEF)-like protein/PAS domain S-box-containing protein
VKESLYILLVDDDEEEYVLLNQMIANASHELVQTVFQLDWVESYAEALEAYDKQEYDAYLVDYHLGEYTGLDLTEEAIQRGIKAPVILLTGQGSYNIDLAAMEAGAADYLVKSELNLSLLERSIRYAIEQKQVKDRLEKMVEERTRELRLTNRELQAEVARRRLVEDGLRDSEAKFRTLADTTSAAIFIVQEENIRYANPAARFITGYDLDELRGEKLWLIVHPDYQTALRNHGLATGWAAGLPSRYEIKVVTKDGQERWVDVSAGEISLEGSPAWVLTAFDITERDLAERELRKAKQELEERVAQRTLALRQANARLESVANEARRKADEMSAIFDSMVEAVTVFDAEGRLLTANRVAMQVLDLDPRGMDLPQLRSLFELSEPSGKSLSADLDPIGRALQGDIVRSLRVLLKAGQEQVALTVSASPLYHQNQLSGVVAVWQDVSERERLMDQLEAERARLKTIIEVAPAAILLTDNQARIQLANPVASQILGETVNPDHEATNLEKLRIYSPEGKPYVLQENILYKASLNGESHQDVEMIVETAKGERYVILGSAIPVHDRKGELTGAVGLFQDITRRKQAEEEIQRRARELNALHEAAQALLGTLELDAVLAQILDAVHKAIPAAEKGLLHLVLPRTGDLALSAISGFDEGQAAEASGLLTLDMENSIPNGSRTLLAANAQAKPGMVPNPRVGYRARRSHPGYPGKVVREKKSLLIGDLPAVSDGGTAGEDLFAGPIPPSLVDARSLLAVPLLHREECFGSLALASNTGQAFQEEDQKLLESLAAAATAAIENARLYAEVQRLSMTDTLTELYNRRGLRAVGQREIERARRFERPISVVLLDIDHFKDVNDTYGHPVGDEILRGLAHALRSMLRRVDIIARYGGEEFAVIMPESSLVNAMDTAERVRKYFAATSLLTSAGEIPITLSLGVAEVSDCILDLDGLIECADQALYKAKARGRNRVEKH